MSERAWSESRWSLAAAIMLVAAALYIGLSFYAYNWRHPEVTQMQMLHYHLLDALRWRP